VTLSLAGDAITCTRKLVPFTGAGDGINRSYKSFSGVGDCIIRS
jgi:hypothetical protein